MAFRLVASPMEEMERLERLKRADPESAANVVVNGKLLVEYTEKGELRALQMCLEHINEGDVLAYYSVRMFRAACASQRLDILRFLVTNGFDLQHASMRNILHDTVGGIAEDDAETAERAQALIRFLLDNGVDVNWQRKGDLLTALHIACRKGLYGIAYLLVLYGADVNAIALHDEMPLTCAMKASQSPNQSQRQQNECDQLVNFLVENHARETWRRQPAPRAAKLTSTTATNNQHDQTNSFVPDDINASRGKILSFSGCVSFHSTGPEIDEAPPTQGLMFDTPM